MGREYVEYKVCCSVSRHNSDQDKIDDSLFEEMTRRMHMIANEHKYSSISPMDNYFG